MKVNAKRWDGGWELHVEGVGVTQVRTLSNAARQSADLVETMTGEAIDPSDLNVVVEIGEGLAERAREVRMLLDAAEMATIRAAKESREVVAALRGEGLSVTDTALVMGVSRGRISQLSH